MVRKDEIRDAGLKRALLHKSRDCVAAGPRGAGGLAKAIRPNPVKLGWQVLGWGSSPEPHKYSRGDVGCVYAESLDIGINFLDLAR